MFTDEQKLDKFLNEVEIIVMEELKLRSGIRSALNLMGVAQKVEMISRMHSRIRYAGNALLKKQEAEAKAASEKENNQDEQTTEEQPAQPAAPVVSSRRRRG